MPGWTLKPQKRLNPGSCFRRPGTFYNSFMKKLRSLLQYVFFLGFGVFLVWWSLRKIDSNDWADIKRSFENANYWLVVPVIISLLLSHLSRAMRWKILMEPL